MHELGHNLGLYHGGSQHGSSGGAFNYKPNYVSIMNYAYESNGFPILTTSTTTGSGYSYRIDCSDETLPSLNEFNLDEGAGVGSALHPNDLVSWFCLPCGGSFLGPAVGPIDWNQDGDTTNTNLAIDLNNDGSLSGALLGFNDWDEVHQFLADEDKHPKNPDSASP